MNALKSLLLSAALLFSSVSVWALNTPIELWPSSVPYPGLSSSLGDTQVHDWLNDVINNYNTVEGTSLPTLLPGSVSLVPADYSQSGGFLSVTGLSGYDYIVMHYGNKDSDGEKNLDVWYLDGVSSYTFPIPSDYVNDKGKFYGISFVRVYDGSGGSVPDSSASIALLGISLLALAGIARRRR
jgi:hypothetical protein